MASPQFLGISLEEHGIQFLSETIDVEILEIILFFLSDHALQVTAARFHRRSDAHVLYGAHLQRDRVVKKLLFVVDAGHSLTQEHDAVFLLRIRSAFGQCFLSPQFDVIKRRGSLHGHQILPPFAHSLILREKAVSADIHAMSVMYDRTGNAANGLGFLQYHDLHRRFSF